MTELTGILNRQKIRDARKQMVLIIICFSLFVAGLQFIGAGFQHLGQGLADSIFEATSNPFIGLFIGLLVTAILQSSSTTTTMAVAFVATGALPLTHAVPIVIGANIGTTLTSTLVSLSYITKKSEFLKAFSAGIVHDIFNITIALIIFPLELKYQLLSNASSFLAKHIPVSEGSYYIKGIDKLFLPINEFMIHYIGGLFSIVIGLVFLFSTVKIISQLLYKSLIGRTGARQSIFDNHFQSFSWGFLITSAMQSSSLSTSLMVPLVATGKINLKRAFAFIIGANIGTTVTALIAALFQSEVAISLALAHFIFNVMGGVIYLAFPVIFNVTIILSEKLGMITLKKRTVGLVYILITFFLLPFTLIYFSKEHGNTKKEAQYIEQKTEKDPTDLQE